VSASRHGVFASTLLTSALLLTAFGVTAHAEAQACCVGGGGQLGVVGRERRAALTAQMSYQRALGSYAADGDYHRLDASIDDVTLDLGGGVRFVDHRIELSALVPTRLQHRAYRGSEGSTRVGIGDVSLGAGVMVVRGSVDGMRRAEPRTWVPFVDLSFGVVLPTGRAPEDSTDQNGADVTGTGHLTLQGGLRVAQFLSMKQILTLSLLYEQGLARDVSSLSGTSHRFRPGRAVTARVSWLYARDMIWSGGLFANARFGAAAHQDGLLVHASGTRRLSLGGLLSWVFDLPYWEATLSLSLDAFFDGVDRNLPQVGPTASLLIKRSF